MEEGFPTSRGADLDPATIRAVVKSDNALTVLRAGAKRIIGRIDDPRCSVERDAAATTDTSD
jgi:hypothetical protein